MAAVDAKFKKIFLNNFLNHHLCIRIEWHIRFAEYAVICTVTSSRIKECFCDRILLSLARI